MVQLEANPTGQWGPQNPAGLSQKQSKCFSQTGTTPFQPCCFVRLFVSQKCWLTLPLNRAPQMLHQGLCNSRENELNPQKPGAWQFSPNLGFIPKLHLNFIDYNISVSVLKSKITF